MQGGRCDEYNSVSSYTSRGQKPGHLLQVLRILVHRHMLLALTCKQGDDNIQAHLLIKICHKNSFKAVALAIETL